MQKVKRNVQTVVEKAPREFKFLIGPTRWVASQRELKLHWMQPGGGSAQYSSMALGWREQMREEGMTHHVGVLVASELHQRWTVPPLPGSGAVLASTTLMFSHLHAASTVLPHAHPAARRDVFLVAVSGGRSGSAVQGKTVRRWRTCLSSHCRCRNVFISSTLEERRFGAQAVRSSLTLLFLRPFRHS